MSLDSNSSIYRITDFQLELAIGNVVRRVLYLIREEYVTYQKGLQGKDDEARVLDLTSSPALYKMLGHDENEDFSEPYDILSLFPMREMFP